MGNRSNYASRTNKPVHTAATVTWGYARPGYDSLAGRGKTKHLMAERLAAYRRRGYLIRDRAKALGLGTITDVQLAEIIAEHERQHHE